MYKSFIRPSLEYGDIIWNNLDLDRINQLESVQKECIRVITGLTRSCTLHNLYSESGFQPLSSRRKNHKLCMFYKIKNGLVPEFLLNKLPPMAATRNHYNVRHRDLFTPIRCNTKLYRNSFFPSTVREWNELPTHVRDSPSLEAFKQELIKLDGPKLTPPWFYSGNRKNNILLNRLRNGCSGLNGHLFQNHVRNDKICNCGYTNESVTHYFLHCPNHDGPRREMLNNLTNLFALREQINTLVLLFGSENLSIDDNISTSIIVQNFILKSNRFI